ncbi:methyltransferase [Methanothrix sp.]|uniref:methyltransferase n=1 Tax=Methanothrix sp. TaxID=90426 RepID=UPI00257F566B|nr:methyltransferase [Methanothrix sp.]
MLENVKNNFDQVLESSITPTDVRKLSLYTDAFYVVSSALEAGVFQGLTEPKSSLELATTLGLNPVVTEKLCRALTSLGYLCRDDKSYYLSDLARTFLVESSPFYQGNLMRLMKKTREQRWSCLVTALKNGPVSVHSGPQVFDELFSLAMAEAAIGGSLQKTIRLLRELPEFYKARRCLDLGGGHGLYALAFSKLNPELEVVVFDLPHVINNVTRKVVSDTDNIIMKSGDFNRDDLGKDYDFVFASDVLYREETSLRPLLGRIRECLNQGGLLICKNYYIDDPSADTSAVLFDLMFSISGTGGVVYSSADFCNLLESSGFYVVRIEDISSSVSPSKIVIARKVRG